MEHTTVTIIGAGQAGLAMSKCLTDRSIDHLVLERSEVASAWKTERWDSLRLLTPNWMTRLPGFNYEGPDPDGYMTAAEVHRFLAEYGNRIHAPVRNGVLVESIKQVERGHLITTNHGQIETRAVVVATGACGTPKIPAVAAELPNHIRQLAPINYKNPGEIEGGVLVVGASASGAQLADELAKSGHEVTLAVGEHTRLPRTYRGMDIHWWMDTIGLLNDRYDEVEDISRARRLPSLQLIGSPEKRTLDMNALQASGVTLVGRLAGVRDKTAQFSGSLANVCAAADLKMGRLLDEIDSYATAKLLDQELGDPDRPVMSNIPTPETVRNLADFKTIVWATGFRPNYPWLDSQLLDHKGGIKHDGGVMFTPGMYVLGLPFGRHRKSSFLDGVGPDALELSSHLATYLDRQTLPIG